MRLFILSAFILFASCNTLTIEGQLFDKVWQLSTVNGSAIGCDQLDRLIFKSENGDDVAQLWPACIQFNLETHPLTISGDVLAFGEWTFVIQDITETRLVMTLGSAEWVYYSL